MACCSMMICGRVCLYGDFPVLPPYKCKRGEGGGPESENLFVPLQVIILADGDGLIQDIILVDIHNGEMAQGVIAHV